MAATNLSNLVVSVSSYPNTTAPVRYQQIGVYNTAMQNSGVTDGGVCCCFKPPANTTYVTFELWGSGGDGAGGCCCAGQYRSAAAGTYYKKTLNSNICPYYIVCAGGSGCCAQALQGTCGFPSFATNGSTTVACAAGGVGACAYCGHDVGCTPCNGMCAYSCNTNGGNTCAGLGDFGIASLSQGTMDNYFCNQYTQQLQPGAHKYGANSRHALQGCCTNITISGCCRYGNGSYALNFPGGPGSTGVGCGGGCCWGGWGLGGMALITYG